MKAAVDVINPDLSRPIDAKNIQLSADSDCFGVEWEPGNAVCGMCHANPICAIVFNQQTKKMVKAVEEEVGPFLDEIDFDAVPWDKFYMTIATNPITYDQLVEAVAAKSKCSDLQTVRYQIDNWMRTKNVSYGEDDKTLVVL